MNIIAFGASSSRQSINQQFAHFTALHFGDEVQLLDLNDFEMPIYSIDREKETGFPEKALEFLDILADADLLVISMTEHNGAYSAAFKNILDWTSRAENNIFQNKPMVLLSTSPGGFGGGNVMKLALTRFPKHGAEIIGNFSLPKFHENFKDGIVDEELNKQFQEMLQSTQKTLKTQIGL
jgi:NAD(P)H-dependent FMN reductase